MCVCGLSGWVCGWVERLGVGGLSGWVCVGGERLGVCVC